MAETRSTLVALGDCNTLGIEQTRAVAYPMQLAQQLGVEAVNCGHTMSTVREAREYARRRLDERTRFLTIQYGLVDSWATFRGAPYVLYYPDNSARKLLRKLVKKYKKVGRRLGFHRWFGEQPVVPLPEYEETLREIIALARQRAPDVRVCLIATAPSLETYRNPGIEHYNAALARLAEELRLPLVDAYTPFLGRPEFFDDPVHLAAAAHTLIAGRCLAALKP